MDAVGADDGVGLCPGAVGEGKPQARSAAIEADELLAEMNDLGRIERVERRVQFRPMQRNVGRAEAALDRVSHRMRIGDLARIPFAVVSDFGGESDAADVPLEPEPAQHLHGVGIHLDAGADAGECRRLLIDVGAKADFAQRRGSRQSGNPGADDRDRGRRVRHRDGVRDSVSSLPRLRGRVGVGELRQESLCMPPPCPSPASGGGDARSRINSP